MFNVIPVTCENHQDDCCVLARAKGKSDFKSLMVEHDGGSEKGMRTELDFKVFEPNGPRALRFLDGVTVTLLYRLTRVVLRKL
jgi:hypothetical protein